MSEGTRRVFLSRTGVGATAVGVAALLPAVATATVAPGTSPTAAAALDTGSAGGSLVAVIDDVRADAVSIMVGEEEIVVQDRELVARLLRAATR